MGGEALGPPAQPSNLGRRDRSRLGGCRRGRRCATFARRSAAALL